MTVKPPVLGVVVQKSDDRIICYTDPECGVLASAESKAIGNAADKVIALLRAKDGETIKEISKKKNADSIIEQDTHKLERALCLAFERSDLTYEEFEEALTLSAEIAEQSPSANGNLFREIITEQARRIALERGMSKSEAEDCAKQVDKGFDKAGIDQKDDEAATAIKAEKRKSTFRHSIDFDSDTDVFALEGTENYSTEITVSVDTPVDVQIYDKNGRAVVTMYVDEKETITLYPEDGFNFVVKIVDQNADLEGLDSPSDYKIATKAVPVEIPDDIETVIRRINDAYDRSDIVTFVAMLTDDENNIYLEEAIGVGLLYSMTDSCVSCMGMEDGIDIAKSGIAGSLVYNGTDNKDFEFLRGSNMELTYVNHVENGNGVAVKLKILIETDGLEIYSGYTFLQLEYIEDRTTFADLNSESDLKDIFTCFYGDNYYITEINSDHLFYAFGNTPGDVQSSGELASLYDLWTCKTEDIGDGLSVELKSVDETLARNKGHNEEKIESFNKFTTRHNLMTLKSQRAQLQVAKETLALIGEYGGDVSDLIDFAIGFSTNPYLASALYLGNQIDNLDGEQNDAWKIFKASIDLDGAAADEAKNIIFAAAKEESERCAALISEVDRLIAREESALNN